jgi:hypothetical protein
LCQRYYWRDTSALDSSSYHSFAWGDAGTTTRIFVMQKLPVQMRTAPSATTSTLTGFSVYAQNSQKTINTAATNDVSPTHYGFYMDCPTSSFTAGNAVRVIANGNNTAYIEYSAEL